MSRIRTVAIQRVAVVALVGMLGLGAAACSSSGGAKTQNGPSQTQAPAGSPSTSAPSSGGAGF